jgi:hypothetical protein
MFLPRQCGELGSHKAAAILGRLRVCRARMELSPMLRAAHPHPAQACLAFANPSDQGRTETKFATRLHAAQLPSLEGEDKATFNLIIFVVKSVHN